MRTVAAQGLLRLLGVAAIAVAPSGADAAGEPEPGVIGIPAHTTSTPAFAVDGRIAVGLYSQGSLSGHNFNLVGLLGSDGRWYASVIMLSGASARAMTFDAMGRIVVAWSDPERSVSRYRSDGEPSTTFARTDLPVEASALVLDAEQRPVIGYSWSPSTIVARLKRNGGFDDSFGSGGKVALGSPDPAASTRLVALRTVASGGIVVVHGTAAQWWMQRLDGRGAIDRTFGVDGVAGLDPARAATIDRFGRVVVATSAAGTTGSVLRRFVDGRPDPAFGAGGSTDFAADVTALATDAQGNVYAGWLETTASSATYRVARLDVGGVPDGAYGVDGTATITLPLKPENPPYPAEAAFPPMLDVDHDGRLNLTARRKLQYFSDTFVGDIRMIRFTGDAPPPPAAAVAIEYFHATMGHYVTTADADEIAALDAGTFDGWVRTGESFAVAVRSTGDALPTCRFFSGQTFAPKSSHFYTPYPGECDLVDANAEWSFEKIAYWLDLPLGLGDGNGTCAPPLRPLYRAFNRMQGGAPNHRYTTSAATLDGLLAQGWQFEGEANTRVFACVP